MKTPALRNIQVRVQVELAAVSEVKRLPAGGKESDNYHVCAIEPSLFTNFLKSYQPKLLIQTQFGLKNTTITWSMLINYKVYLPRLDHH